MRDLFLDGIDEHTHFESSLLNCGVFAENLVNCFIEQLPETLSESDITYNDYLFCESNFIFPILSKYEIYTPLLSIKIYLKKKKSLFYINWLPVPQQQIIQKEMEKWTIIKKHHARIKVDATTCM
jgi:hypothetical protein